jgi:neutral ceramidase
MRLSLSVSVALAIVWCGSSSFAAEMKFPVQSNLRAAAMKLDITPKVVEGMYAAGHHRQVTGVRDPLRAGVLVLDDGKTQAAIITLDTLGAWEELVRRTRAAIADLTDIPPEHIMITAAHNHSGPAYDPDSEWGLKLVNQLADAAAQLVGQLKPVTIGYAEDRISFNILAIIA